MTAELLDLICTINIQTIGMDKKHEQTAWTRSKKRVFYLNISYTGMYSVKCGCRLHSYCEPSANKERTEYAA